VATRRCCGRERYEGGGEEEEEGMLGEMDGMTWEGEAWMARSLPTRERQVMERAKVFKALPLSVNSIFRALRFPLCSDATSLPEVVAEKLAGSEEDDAFGLWLWELMMQHVNYHFWPPEIRLYD